MVVILQAWGEMNLRSYFVFLLFIFHLIIHYLNSMKIAEKNLEQKMQPVKIVFTAVFNTSKKVTNQHFSS